MSNHHPLQRSRRPRNICGFSLFELMIGLALTAFLVSIALPGFRGGVDAANAMTVRTALLNTLQRAVSEAAVTGTRAVVCPSADGASCVDDPSWNGGWIGYLDRNGDREHAPDEHLFGIQPALPGRVGLRSSPGRTRIVFQSSGGNGGSNVTFTLCDGRGPAKAVALTLNNRGRWHQSQPDPDRVALTCLE